MNDCGTAGQGFLSGRFVIIFVIPPFGRSEALRVVIW